VLSGKGSSRQSKMTAGLHASAWSDAQLSVVAIPSAEAGYVNPNWI